MVSLLSPQGRLLDQAAVRRLAERQELILVCGRYEGIDERLIELEIDEEWSLGDYVLSGGELAAAVVIDAVTRLQPGVLGDEQSAAQDSFTPMACMTSEKPGECPDFKRQMGRWEVKEGLGIKTKKVESKKRSAYACPMHPDVISDKSGKCNKYGMNLEKTTQVLAIPATAVLDTGIRKIVYLEKGSGQYVGKEVVLGPRAGDYYPVLEGLNEGDKVVTSANFLIDSQSQLTGGASALYGGAMEFKEEK